MSNIKEIQKILNNYVENTGGKENKINDIEYFSDREKTLINTIEKLTERIDRLETVIVRSIGDLLEQNLCIDITPINLYDGTRTNIVKIADYVKK